MKRRTILAEERRKKRESMERELFRKTKVGRESKYARKRKPVPEERSWDSDEAMCS
jgi:hypothetical protein